MDSLTWLSAFLTLLFLALALIPCYNMHVPAEKEIPKSNPSPKAATYTLSPQYVPMKYQTCTCSLVKYPKPGLGHRPTTNRTSLPDPLLQYQDYLRDVYHRNNYSKYSKLSEFLAVNRPERPIDLVLFHKEKQRDSSHNEHVKFVFRDGKVDEIQKQKTTIKIEEIGSTSEGNMYTAAHFVLIEGAPGVGKSTLCWQLCRLWSEGKLQHDWDLVVLVELRDETIRKATSVYDLLYHPDDKIRKLLAQEILLREGKGLMVIFDGYDELSFDQRNEFSLIQQILSNRILEKATIVVTSRPIAMKRLPNQFVQTLDKHIEIVGFNETDIHTYITLACKDNIELSKSLRLYISSQPFILSIMYNPLHCTIVTELYIQYWQYGQKEFAPSTLTELYNALVAILLKRSLPLHQSSDIEELTDLPTHVYNNLMQLAELAANGLTTSQYIYNNVPCDTLGLMVSVRQIHDVRPKKTAYMFLHVTLQEYLSALYLHHRIEQQQTESLYWINVPVIQLRDSLPHHFQHPILQEYWYQQQTETMNVINVPFITGHLSSGFNRDRLVQWPYVLFLAGLTKLSPELLQAMISKEYLKGINNIGPLCQLLFESQSPQKVSDMFSQTELDLFVSETFDWFAIGYCIANSNNKSSWNINFLNSPQHLQLLSHGLHYSKNNIHLDLSGLTINMYISLKLASPAKYSALFSTLYPFTKAISHLSLTSYNDEIYPHDECCFHVLHNLSFCCPNLKSLSLSIFGGCFVSKKPLDIPKEVMLTFQMMLPRHSVLFDSLHQYQSLSEIHLYNTDQ